MKRSHERAEVLEHHTDPLENRILAALGEDERARLMPHLEFMEMKLDEIIHRFDEAPEYAWFPVDGLISLLCVMENGASAEVSITGNDGMLGVGLFMGGGASPGQAVVQAAGSAWRLPADALKEEFRRGGRLQEVLLCYTQCLMMQMAQTAVCNRYHSVEQQLCRWLLISIDRLPTNRLLMTHGLISDMLGVRRESVSEASGRLQKLGAIRNTRGRIEVLDRPLLEKLACPCYAVVKRATDRVQADCRF
ncbi:MAG TPA: Crp/Fnr family transcriptional regulator [Gammaproteobacteria bacterium]